MKRGSVLRHGYARIASRLSDSLTPFSDMRERSTRVYVTRCRSRSKTDAHLDAIATQRRGSQIANRPSQLAC